MKQGKPRVGVGEGGGNPYFLGVFKVRLILISDLNTFFSAITLSGFFFFFFLSSSFIEAFNGLVKYFSW